MTLAKQVEKIAFEDFDDALAVAHDTATDYDVDGDFLTFFFYDMSQITLDTYSYEAIRVVA